VPCPPAAETFLISLQQGLHGNELISVKKSAREVLSERREIWARKPIIRRLYSKWYGLIKECLRPGRTLEMGGGSGNLKDFLPGAITSDIVFEPWLDAVMDAHAIPFKRESLDNIVLFDVLHHLMAPAVFFDEVERVLRPAGRAILMEPYVSWLSYPVYRFLHAEGMAWDADPFLDQPSKRKEPFAGNQAVPTLLFEKYREKFLTLFPRLSLIQERKLESLIYPLSGGFHQPSLCPLFLWGFIEGVERLLNPLARFLAFRLFIVLEKRE
jgi:SAM-dependent methyltransferase